jgi:hypothetical protein
MRGNKVADGEGDLGESEGGDGLLSSIDRRCQVWLLKSFTDEE